MIKSKFAFLGFHRPPFLAAIVFLYAFGIALSTPAKALTEVPAYGVYEVTFTTSNTYPNPYKDVTLSVTFLGPNTTIVMSGFWDGSNTWKVRVAPTEVGTWSLTKVVSNDPQLNGQNEGIAFSAHTPTAADIVDNEILRHGFIRVSQTHPHTFEHADGTPFFLLGDTQWERAILASDGLTIDGAQLFQEYQYRDIKSRSRQGFNAASMATIEANAHILNEGGNGAFIGPHTDERPNIGFFQAADDRIAYMNSKNIRPFIVLGSPDHGLTSNTGWIERFTKYMVARYAAYDVIWLGMKEYVEYPGGGAAQADAYGNTIELYDPYGHPTSIHPGGNTVALDNRPWLDFHAIQGRTVPSSLYARGKPVVIVEGWYEYEGGNQGTWSFTPQELLGTAGIWAATMNGGYQAGYEYIALPRGDTTAIFSNMDTTSIQYFVNLKRFFESTEFWRLVPHDELLKSGAAEVMAQETNENDIVTGLEYALFLPTGGTITLDLSAASGFLSVNWYNPKTGAFTEQSSVEGGSDRMLSAPDAQPWVLSISAGNLADPPPRSPGSLTIQ